MSRKRKEKHTDLIDSLAAVMFPHQESEEEQESFTDVGRQRVDEWLDKLLSRLSRALAGVRVATRFAKGIV